MSSILDFISRIGFLDIIDVLLVTYVIYYLIKLVTGTKAAQIIKGIAILLVITLLSDIMKLNALNYILRNTLQVGFIALIVLFQPELRKALEKVGRKFFTNLVKQNENMKQETEDVIFQLSEAVNVFSKRKIGALIVFERDTNLEELLIGKYSAVDSLVTSSVLQNIFYPNTPLHDGAVIIRENRIYAANCYLPLTGIESLDSEMGTRHRAGIGITELSDCISVIVSEETGIISVAKEGMIERNLSPAALSKKLSEFLIDTSVQTERKKWLKGKVN